MPSLKDPGKLSLTHTLVALLGVGSLALIAGINDDIGKVVIIFMFGIALVWLLTNLSFVQGWFKKGGISS